MSKKESINNNLNVYSQAEYEHYCFSGEPFSGYVEGIGYVLKEVVVTATPINRSGTEVSYNVHNMEFCFSGPDWIKHKELKNASFAFDTSQEIKDITSSPVKDKVELSMGDKLYFVLYLAKEQLFSSIIPHDLVTSKYASPLLADLIITAEFFTGTGPLKRELGPETASTKSLRNSHLTHIALVKFIEKSNYMTEDYTEPIGVGFNPLEKTDSGPFIEFFYDQNYNTAQFVGSANYTFTINGDNVEVLVTNTTSQHSAFLHLDIFKKPSRKETFLGIMGNVDQTYKFSMSKEEVLKKGRRTRGFTTYP